MTGTVKSYSHAPDDYLCPFCVVVSGQNDERVATRQQDIVYQDPHITAFIASNWWPNNKGHVIIVPNEHYENIFDLPIDYAEKIHVLAQRIAYAFKDTYGCDGVSTRQHNEPAGSQSVWHYHLNIFPRYQDDKLYMSKDIPTTIEERLEYTGRLKRWIQSNIGETHDH